MPQGDFITILLQDTLWSNRVQSTLYIPTPFTSCPNDLPLITHKKQNTNLGKSLLKKKKKAEWLLAHTICYYLHNLKKIVTDNQ